MNPPGVAASQSGYNLINHTINCCRNFLSSSARTWATDFDSPADAVGYKYYIQAVDANDAPLAPPSSTVNFAAG